MNKGLWFILFFYTLSVSVLLGQNRDELFQQGVKYYKARQYDSAVVNFDKILKRGYESGELYFNLGNAWYRQGNIGMAILNYYKAQKFMGNDPDLIHNLKLAEKAIENPILVPRPIILFRVWNSILHVLSLNTAGWTLFCGLLGILLLSGLLLVVKSERQYTLMKRVRTTFVAASIAAFLLLIIQINRYRHNRYAVIVSEKAVLRSEPIENGTELLIIPVGTRVKNIKSSNHWLEVELPDGNRGWVLNDKLKNI